MSVQENASKGAESSIDAGSMVQTDPQALFTALHTAHAVVKFAADGTAIFANQIFLDLVGYKEGEILAQNHRIFCSAAHAGSDACSDAWMRLTMGEAITCKFECLKKDGSDIYVSAFYTPVLVADGTLARVVVLSDESEDTSSDI